MSWDENSVRRVHIDYPLLVTVVLLTGLGLTMVFSASAVLAQEKFGGSFYFLKRHVFYAGLGLMLMFGMTKIPYRYWRKAVYPLLALCLVGMFLTLFSGWGVSVGGARRWLDIGWIRFQPSEAAKVALVLFLAYSIEKKREKMETFTVGLLPNIMIAGVLILFVLAGRDLGSAFVMGVLVLGMLFLGGAQLKHLGLFVLATLPSLYFLIMQEGYRLRRILAFLNPWDDRFGAGFQIIQSFLAFNEGGFIGKGLGAGQQKLFYLPEAHTDFIFSVLGEELGVVGVLITIALFLFLSFRGIRIAARAPDAFGRLSALGVVTLVGIQSLLNMGVVLGLLPTKGLVLPFIGYGGTALVVTLIGMGLLLNISTYQKVSTPPMFGKRRKENRPREEAA